MSATRDSRSLPTVLEFLAYLFIPAANSSFMYIGPCDRPAPEMTGSPKPNEPENREPIPMGEVIQVFRSQPEMFVAATFPDPPKAA